MTEETTQDTKKAQTGGLFDVQAILDMRRRALEEEDEEEDDYEDSEWADWSTGCGCLQLSLGSSLVMAVTSDAFFSGLTTWKR